MEKSEVRSRRKSNAQVRVASVLAFVMAAHSMQLPELELSWLTAYDPGVQTAQAASRVTEAVFVAVRTVVPSDCLPEEKKKEERN